MNKRGISERTLIIGLVIGLVLIVLIVAFVGQKGQFFVKSTTCEGQGNVCVASLDECTTIPIQLECKGNTTPICCKG